MNIYNWLDDFEQAWESKDVDRVMNLFADDVDYYETPFQEFSSREELRREWETVREQQDIKISTEVFSHEKDKFTVKWKLSYSKAGDQKVLKGIYLIRLDSDNKCFEFWQYAVEE